MARFVIEDAPAPAAAAPKASARFVIEDAPAAPTQRDRYLSHPLVRLAKGAKDGIDAGAQMVPRVLNAFVRGGMPEEIELDPIRESISRWLQDERASVDKDIADSEAEYQQARQRTAPQTLSGLVTGKTPDPGFDGMRLVGNVVSPANALPAKFVPVGGFTTAAKAAKTGAVAGGAGAVLQPVTDPKAQAEFGQAKAEQGVVGATAGAVLSPVLSKVIPTAVSWFGNVKGRNVSEASIDAAVARALKDAKIEGKDLAPEIIAAVKAEVRTALQSGKMPDAAALARKAEFESIGVKNATTGQITRDAGQWTREMNLRAAPGGEDLQMVMVEQERQLADALGKLAGKADPYKGGEKIKAALAAVDQEAEGKANVLYQGFRDLMPDVQVKDPARFSNGLLERLEGDVVNAALGADWHNRLNKITKGEFPLTPSTLHQMYQAANRQLRSAKGSEEHALGIVKKALNDEMLRLAEASATKAAPAGSVVTAGTVAPEVSNSASLRGLQSLKLGQRQVAERYGLQEELPALKAAVKGDISGEEFVNRFIVGEDTAKVKKLGEVLRKASPESWNEARGQIGATLQKAAYGSNAAGDKGFSADRFQKALDAMGDDKLLAFYSPKEVEALHTIARVGAYMNSAPAKAAPNTSNTAAAVMQLLGKLPLGNKVISLGASAMRAIENDQAMKRAIAGKIPTKRSAEVEAQASKALTTLAVGGGVAAGAGSR